jgi:anti-sigma-K factor RskA
MSKEIEELLPFYVNNTLSAAEHKLVEDALAQDPELRSELELLQHLQSDMKALELEQSPGELGLKRLQKSLQEETASLSRPAANDNSRNVMWRIGAVAACMLLALQTAIYVPDWGGDDLDAAGGAIVQPHGVLYSITFAPDAREETIRSLMLSLNARFVDEASQKSEK